MSTFIQAPMVNANEDTATLIEWYRQPGDSVHRGEMICLLETSKSTFELQADSSGYFEPLVAAGEAVKVGQYIAVLKDSIDEDISIPETASRQENEAETPRRWTKKAEILAQKHGLDLAALAEARFPSQTIGEKDILDYLASLKHGQRAGIDSRLVNRTQRVLILGGGNIAVLVMDILGRIPHQRAVGILDDNPDLTGSSVQGCPILGRLDDVLRLWEEKAFDVATLAIGVLPLRAELYEKYTQSGIPFGNIIDPTALVLSDVTMGTGNMIMGFCRIGPQAIIGNNNFLSAYINLEHHNHLGDHCTFGPGVVTSGGVIIGSHVRFGTGIFIEPRLKIGDDVTVASGVTLTTNVPSHSSVKAKANFSITPK